MRTGGPASFLFQFDRLAPSESGTVFIDGVSQGGAGTDASGKGMITLTRPAAIGPHSVIFAGVSGDLAIAPLYVICAASYNFTLGTATFVPGVTDIGNHCDDCDTTISLPFPVMLYDQTFTTAKAGSNGHLTFGRRRTRALQLPVHPSGSRAPPMCWLLIGLTSAPTTLAPAYDLHQLWDLYHHNRHVLPTACSTSSIEPATSIETLTLNYEVALFENGSPPFQYIYNTINPAATSKRQPVGGRSEER